MRQKALSHWLKGIVIGLALCGAVVYLAVLPALGQGILVSYPELSHWFWPWLIFLWLTGIPCYAALVLGWRIAGNIGRDRSFCPENARWLSAVAHLAAGDAAFFFVGNAAMVFMNMHQPGMALLSLLVVFAGVAVAVAAACLSHLVMKASALQEQSDLTI